MIKDFNCLPLHPNHTHGYLSGPYFHLEQPEFVIISINIFKHSQKFHFQQSDSEHHHFVVEFHFDFRLELHTSTKILHSASVIHHFLSFSSNIQLYFSSLCPLHLWVEFFFFNLLVCYGKLNIIPFITLQDQV